MVLDVMMPKLDGFAVCRRLRAESAVPIVFLSSLDAIAEKVAGLDLGADDYLSKPFSPKELEARINRILGRVGRGTASQDPREPVAGLGANRRRTSRHLAWGERLCIYIFQHVAWAHTAWAQAMWFFFGLTDFG